MVEETKVFIKDETKILLPSNYSFEKLYNSLLNIVGDNNITISNIILIATNLMQTVEKYHKLSGTQKKNLIIHVIKLYVIKHSENDDNEDNLMFFIETILPNVIDTIISVDKKEFVITIQKKYKKCFNCCK